MRVGWIWPALLAGCLDSPPGSVEQPPPDAKPPGADGAPATCTGLDRLVESFEEPDALAVFDDLWDQGDAVYTLAGGQLVLMADNGTSLINSATYWATTGALRIGPITLDPGSSAHISVYGEAGTSRITIHQSTLDLYHLADHVPLDREPEDQFYAIEFPEGEIVLSAAPDGDSWHGLYTASVEMNQLVRISLAADDSDGVSSFFVGGINTPETGAPSCPSE
jgi:hypothetical protein